MQKTILLTQSGPLSTNATKWLLTIAGLLYSAIGIIILTQHPIAIWPGISLIGIGLLQVTFAFLKYDERSMVARKCIIDEHSISIREGHFQPTSIINWHDIKLIEFKSLALEFHSNDNKVRHIILRTSADNSVEIKKSLRELAEKKGVSIKGG